MIHYKFWCNTSIFHIVNDSIGGIVDRDVFGLIAFEQTFAVACMPFIL